MNLDVQRAIDGFTSKDFPGVSPRTRHGSYLFAPAYRFPQPTIAWGKNFFQPLGLGLLRFPELFIRAPNLIPLTTISMQQTPTIRKQRTGSVSF